MSKGSLQRPCNRAKYEANYERVFGKKKNKNKTTILGREVEYEPTLPERGIDLRVYTKDAPLMKCVNGEYWCERCPDGCEECNYE